MLLILNHYISKTLLPPYRGKIFSVNSLLNNLFRTGSMKRMCLIAGIFLIFSSFIQGQEKSYKVGEKVSYVIQYGFITAGTGQLELSNDVIDGKPVFHSKLEARTTGMAEAFFKLIDIYESYMDTTTGLPVKSIRNIREGRYRNYNVVKFDHVTRSDSSILLSDLTGKHIAPPRIHDILSCFYFFRNNILPDISKVKKGEIITIMTWFCDELYPIRLKYYGTDEVKTRLGKIKCYKFNPVTETGRLFKTEEDVSFWFSADQNYLPVKIRFDIFVGSFSCEITSCEGLIYPLGLKKK
jgi:hypothetical protein